MVVWRNNAKTIWLYFPEYIRHRLHINTHCCMFWATSTGRRRRRIRAGERKGKQLFGTTTVKRDTIIFLLLYVPSSKSSASIRKKLPSMRLCSFDFYPAHWQNFHGPSDEHWAFLGVWKKSEMFLSQIFSSKFSLKPFLSNKIILYDFLENFLFKKEK